MKRQVSLEEISDGKLYRRQDLARIGCGGCRGCSQCCHGMGESAILDPLDVHRIVCGTGKSFEELMADRLELHVVDGIILPNLNMSGEGQACGFLNREGRCSIHSFRPGVCRLFPLGRYYDPSDPSVFHYFVQIHECPAPNKTKVKIEKWLDTPQTERYESFVLKWHHFLQQAEQLAAHTEEEQAVKNINLYILKLFYIKPYDPKGNFYGEFEDRLQQAGEVLSLS